MSGREKGKKKRDKNLKKFRCIEKILGFIVVWLTKTNKLLPN
jgi:hypothetical protein